MITIRTISQGSPAFHSWYSYYTVDGAFVLVKLIMESKWCDAYLCKEGKRNRIYIYANNASLHLNQNVSRDMDTIIELEGMKGYEIIGVDANYASILIILSRIDKLYHFHFYLRALMLANNEGRKL